MTHQSTRIERERDFWDHMVPTVDEALAEYHAGPEPNTRLMLDAVAPGPGRRILDFACGGGVTSAWLARSGAHVTGVDLSPASIRTAQGVADALGLDIDLHVADVEQLELPPGGFDAVVGRYALHHLDVEVMAPVLARCIAPGGSGAFLETMGLNPFLNVARDHLTGRFGVPRFGTLDEHPLEGATSPCCAAPSDSPSCARPSTGSSAWSTGRSSVGVRHESVEHSAGSTIVLPSSARCRTGAFTRSWSHDASQRRPRRVEGRPTSHASRPSSHRSGDRRLT
jgi:SAM-dependent methyltransferase